MLVQDLGGQPCMFWYGLCGYDYTNNIFIHPHPTRTVTCENTKNPFIDIRFLLSRYIKNIQFYPMEE